MLDAESIIRAAGYIGVFGVIFAESGLLIGFFLPGDSLLFTAGFIAAQGLFGFSFWPLFVGCFIAAAVGDNIGYTFGRRVGPRLFKKENNRLFTQANIQRAQKFYNHHGPKTIVIARFVPIVRTFAPIIAGVARMDYRQFAIYNVAGAFLWTVLLIVLGYSLGNIPGIENYVEWIILGIVAISVLPGIWHVLGNPVRRRKLWQAIRKQDNSSKT